MQRYGAGNLSIFSREKYTEEDTEEDRTGEPHRSQRCFRRARDRICSGKELNKLLSSACMHTTHNTSYCAITSQYTEQVNPTAIIHRTCAYQCGQLAKMGYGGGHGGQFVAREA